MSEAQTWREIMAHPLRDHRIRQVSIEEKSGVLSTHWFFVGAVLQGEPLSNTPWRSSALSFPRFSVAKIRLAHNLIKRLSSSINADNNIVAQSFGCSYASVKSMWSFWKRRTFVKDRNLAKHVAGQPASIGIHVIES